MKNKLSSIALTKGGLFIVFIFLLSCTPPRAMNQSARVCPHKEVMAGGDFTGNFTSHFAKSLYQHVESVATPLLNKDTLTLDEQIIFLNRTALAYALDPNGAGYGVFLRYGIYPGLAGGYKLASGTHVFDLQYQFLGPKKAEDISNSKLVYGSLGIQYSFNNYKLPSWKGLDIAQGLLDFKFQRKDILIPLIFTFSFGPDEEYGSLSLGMAYSRSFINYGIGNDRIYDTINQMSPQLLQGFDNKQNYGAVGSFFNLKLGYKYIYGIVSCALYYQNYGTYKLIQGQDANFKGVSIVPSIGIQISPTKLHGSLKKKEDPSL